MTALLYPDKVRIIRPDTFGIAMTEPSPEDKYNAKLVSLIHCPKGNVLLTIRGYRTTSTPAYSSVQVGLIQHVELDSELLYLNHSCDPTLFLDSESMSLIALHDIIPGTELSFFYPSTEWTMAQPFDCWCGASSCLRQITGARDVKAEVLARYRVNPHITQAALSLTAGRS